MSALLPTDTKLEMPMPRRALSSISEMPSAPDCVMNATLPAIGSTGANVAFIRIAASVLASPMQFGPIDTHAVSPRRLHERSLLGATVVAELGEPCADDHDAANVRRAALGDHLGHGACRDRDDGQVRRYRRVADARIRVDAARSTRRVG